MSMPEIVRIFSAGEALPEGEMVTIPEGFNAWEVAGLFKKKGFNAQTEEFLKSEGYLFPDSYYFEKPNEQMTNDKTGEIIKKMRENFEEKTRGLTITPQAVIVASMLEKEVRKAEDMALVAGIIYKRLELGMPLQIDATVAYGSCLNIWTSQVQRTCDVTEINLIENIKIDSPYNTYTRKGLPLGPISNPGLRALNAPLNPVANHFFYFLLKKRVDNGITTFMKKMGTGYSMYFNITRERTGSLFQGPYKAKAVKDNDYLTHLSRYIHMNPVDLIDANWKEVGVKNKNSAHSFIEKYPWSSYADYVSGRESKIISKNILHELFSASDYVKFVQDWDVNAPEDSPPEGGG